MRDTPLPPMPCLCQRFFSGAFFRCAAGLLTAGIVLAMLAERAAGAVGEGEEPPVIRGRFTLDKCIEIALRNHRSRRVSELAIKVAEAQHRQALAAYWPQFRVSAAGLLRDDDLTIVAPAMSIQSPAVSTGFAGGVLPGRTVVATIPAGVLGPGSPAVQIPVQAPALTIPPVNISVPPQTVNVEAQELKLLDRELFQGSLNAQWLLLDGGGRAALAEQARNGIEAARQSLRRTELDIATQVRRLYSSAVLARAMQRIGRTAHGEMGGTLELTEALYKGGAGTVKKNDFLRNKAFVETVGAMNFQLDANVELSRAALINAMGVSWRSAVEVADDRQPEPPELGGTEMLVARAYRFNPDVAKLEAGLKAAAAGLREAKSGWFPRLALKGELMAFESAEDGILDTAANRQSWNVALGIEWPIFDGFLTEAKVKAARARLAQVREQGVLLREGVALLVQNAAVNLRSTTGRRKATKAAWDAARENRETCESGYREGLVDVEKVFESQLLDAFLEAQHERAKYDYGQAAAELDSVLGRELMRALNLERSKP